MKFWLYGDSDVYACRSPCGERGLKSPHQGGTFSSAASLPVRGAWIEICPPALHVRPLRSLPVRGAWIEIGSRDRLNVQTGRSPCGERGLKFPAHLLVRCGAFCRSPCGERGLKSPFIYFIYFQSSRSPCGERGLKFPASSRKQGGAESLPVRGAWIEIQPPGGRCTPGLSLPVRGAWIEIGFHLLAA